MGEGGLKCNPGEIWENTGFWTNLTTKILKNQGCILEKFYVLQSYSKLNKLSKSVHKTSVYFSFQAIQVHQSRNFHFLFLPIFLTLAAILV